MIIRPWLVNAQGAARAGQLLAIVQESYRSLVGDVSVDPITPIYTPDPYDPRPGFALGTLARLLPARERGTVDVMWAGGLNPGGAGRRGACIVDAGNLTRSIADGAYWGTPYDGVRKRAWLVWHEMLHAFGIVEHAGGLYDRELGKRTDTVYSSWSRFASSVARVLPGELETLRRYHVEAVPMAEIEPTPTDGRGWMAGVEHIPTAAAGGYGNNGQMIAEATVWHVMEGHQSTMIDWAKQRPPLAKVSAHFTIGKQGRIVQHVSIRTPAWHAGRVESPTWSGIQAGRINPNTYTIGIECEGFTGEPWPDAQRDAALRVMQWIADATATDPTRENQIGHYEITAVSRRNDPGPTWPIGWLLEQFEDRPELSPPMVLDDAIRLYMAIVGAQSSQGTAAYESLPQEGNVRSYVVRLNP